MLAIKTVLQYYKHQNDLGSEGNILMLSYTYKATWF